MLSNHRFIVVEDPDTLWEREEDESRMLYRILDLEKDMTLACCWNKQVADRIANALEFGLDKGLFT